MLKNQKACPATDRYRKEGKYLIMELWQKSDLSLGKFCSPENLSAKTFSYWYRKYKNVNQLSVKENKETSGNN